MAPPRKRYDEPLMTRKQRAERMEEICRRFVAGSSPNDIAGTFKLTAGRVREILRSRGHDIWADNSRIPHADSMWGLDEDRRREEIIRRAAEGARRTLQMSGG